MKKWALIVFVFWNCAFTADWGKTWKTTRKNMAFDDYAKARRFVDWAPRGDFQCVDSATDKDGYCNVTGFEIKGDK